MDWSDFGGPTRGDLKDIFKGLQETSPPKPPPNNIQIFLHFLLAHAGHMQGARTLHSSCKRFMVWMDLVPV